MNPRLLPFLAVPLVLAFAPVASALTPTEKNLAFDSYNNAFYVANGGNGYYLLDTSRAVPGRFDFWRVCEQIEAAEDAYERTRNPAHRDIVFSLLNGLNNVISKTTDFASWNEYNDDIMWAVIALTRGYEITGHRPFLDQAQWQFNKVWDRAWDNQLGGGFWWRADKQTKNACVAGPATIAAMLLARNTVNTGYRAQADQIYNWLRSTLFNASTGQVADHIKLNGEKVWWAFTYNQGTFAGASALLFQANGNAAYKNAGGLAVNWARGNLTGQHIPDILNDEYDSGGGQGDTAGFKGVFVRWASKWAGVANDTGIKNWLVTNSNVAWSYRNSSGLMWGQWWRRTPDNFVTSWESSPGLAVTQIPY
ncbi:glycoside hydrolase family 76 protein [Stigmatella erecta]|uniref:Glycosyl hydrolase family 76 n=1 Tax=Stigmatella erecta TaxID=83460 RepID=A0A1I0LDU2_9BACT|nr:glycoside hydrolase family 76 protein [Stigmatella erecta]SEU38249.1 Glycosyl hydrolase family 76 [Stigmatella erecta]